MGYRITGDYKAFKGIIKGYRRLQGITGDNKELQGITKVYRGSQGVTGDRCLDLVSFPVWSQIKQRAPLLGITRVWRGLQGFTGDHKWSQGITMVYKG